MSKLMTDFLVSLASTDALKSYLVDPSAYMIRAGLTESQRAAIINGDRYAIRRFSAEEMLQESLHARIVSEVYQELDPNFRLSSSRRPKTPDERDMSLFTLSVDNDAFDIVDTSDETNNHDDGVDMVDLGDDIAEFSADYGVKHYFDHLFSDDTENTHSSKELVFVGTGIKGAHHITPEAEAHIATADVVLYCVADVVMERKLSQLNSNCIDLYNLYGDEKCRRDTYKDMVAHCLRALEEHDKVCTVFYGHPGIFVWPSYRAIYEARKMGINAYMLPAVSSLDCMFADIGFDPSRYGFQLFEATDMLVRRKKPDIGASVVVYQVGCVGDLGFNFKGYDRRNLPIFAEYLVEFYGPEYEVILYEAAQYPFCDPKIVRVKLKDLGAQKTTGITTLYIPPKTLWPVDQAMRERLGLEQPKFGV